MSCQKTRTKQAHWPLQWRNDWNGSTKWLICRRSWSWWTHTGLTFPISHILPISKCAAHTSASRKSPYYVSLYLFFASTAFPTMNSLWTVILVLSTPFSIITGPTWTYKDWLIQNLFYQMLVSSLQTGKDWQTPQSGRGRCVAFRFFLFSR